MANPTLNLSLANPTADEGDYILIEQKEWPKDVGRTSKSQGILTIGALIFGGSLPLPNCGGLAGFDAPVYVYPSRRDLRFVFGLSHGQFMPASIRTMIREEVIQCGLQDSARCDYPVQRMISKKWIGKCYNEEGQPVFRPTISRSGRNLFFGERVYASLRLRYMVRRVTYLVRIEEREDSLENNFDSVVYARWNGGVEYREIESPSGYDDTMGNCGNGIYDSGNICSPGWGQGTYPKAVRADKLTRQDFCSQEIISERITESVETGNTPGEECSDGPLVTN